jgi:hypothetical protein
MPDAVGTYIIELVVEDDPSGVVSSISPASYADVAFGDLDSLEFTLNFDVSGVAAGTLTTVTVGLYGDGTLIKLHGEAISLGAMARGKGYEAWFKILAGHPGTAMSLAPAAYLLYQRVMNHDPADVHWPGRDRFTPHPGPPDSARQGQLRRPCPC